MPFKAYRGQICSYCGMQMSEGDDLFLDDSEKYCAECADELDLVCECGEYKKAEYEKCYECYREEK